jgi:hypothetical protein
MSRLIVPSPASRTAPLTATIRSAGREFRIPLCTRPLDLGPAGTIQYYWANSSRLRSPGAAGAIRSFVDHWWASMTKVGLDGEVEQQVNLVLARCHEVFLRDKAPQAVFRDAHLREGRTRRFDASLDDEARERIKRAVDSRDRAAVAMELDRALGRSGPPEREMPAFRRAFEHWVGRGLVAFRRRGEAGLVGFVREVAEWSKQLRKKGGQGRLRPFLNMLAYETKVAFYLCYANAWVDLIPWIARERGIDALSERFLRIWHNQNQPAEVPAGRTPAGLYLPTAGGRAVVTPSPSGALAVESFSWRPAAAVPGHVCDAFSGQILALHPLSGFFMSDPGLLAVAGRFLACDAFDRVMTTGRAWDCPEYWSFVGAILDAAGMYRLAAEEQSASRGAASRAIGEDESRRIGEDRRIVRPRRRLRPPHRD